MGLGQQGLAELQVGPLTALGGSLVRGLDTRREREGAAKAAELMQKMAEREASRKERETAVKEGGLAIDIGELVVKQEELGLKKEEAKRTGLQADLNLFNQGIEQVKDAAKTNPTQVPTIVAGFKESPQFKKVLERLNLQDVDLTVDRDNLLTASARMKVTPKTRTMLESIGKQMTGIKPSLEDGDDVLFSSSPDTQSFEVDRSLNEKRALAATKSSSERESLVKKEQAQGAKLPEDMLRDGIMSQEDIDLLPEDAFLRIGRGEDQVKLIKKPTKLSADSGGKLAVAQEGSRASRKLLQAIESGEIGYGTLRQAATPGIRRLGAAAQQVQTDLKLMQEGFARLLSGAAIPESEQGNFQELFSIRPTDSRATMEKKLRRNMRIGKAIEHALTFGNSGITKEGILDRKYAREILDKLTLNARQEDKQAAQEPLQGQQPAQPAPVGQQPAGQQAQDFGTIEGFKVKGFGI